MTIDPEITEYYGSDEFGAFMQRANRLVRQKAEGMGILDFADACWRDLFDEDPEASDEAICETLAEADGIFAAFLRLED